MEERGEGAAPVAGEARLIADVEPLAEQTHPLNVGRGLQLSQAAVATFTLVHLRNDKRWRQEGETADSWSVRTKVVHLVADDLPLHGHAEAGERAAAHMAGGDGLAAFGLRQLVGLGLAAVQRLSREEAHVAVAARDDRQQLLLQHQVDVMHLLVVSHPDYF